MPKKINRFESFDTRSLQRVRPSLLSKVPADSLTTVGTGLNPETGECLSEEDAEDLLAEHQCKAQAVSAQLESLTLYHRVSRVLKERKEAEGVFDDAFEQVQTRRQSILLQQQAERAFADFRNAERASWTANSAQKRALDNAKKRVWYKIRKHGEEAAMVTSVLLARWPRLQGGVLRDVAEQQPNLLSVYSEAENCSQHTVGLQRMRNGRPQLLRCA
jgi:hypothetical protein